MFASAEGQAQVAASCRSRRTVLVSMRRGQQYGDVDALKACFMYRWALQMGLRADATNHARLARAPSAASADWVPNLVCVNLGSLKILEHMTRHSSC